MCTISGQYLVESKNTLVLRIRHTWYHIIYFEVIGTYFSLGYMCKIPVFFPLCVITLYALPTSGDKGGVVLIQAYRHVKKI